MAPTSWCGVHDRHAQRCNTSSVGDVPCQHRSGRCRLTTFWSPNKKVVDAEALTPPEHLASLATTADRARSLTFWLSDLHVGLRMDLSSLLIAHGHNVVMGGNTASGPWRVWKTLLPWLMKSPQLSVVPHALRSRMVENYLTTTAVQMPPEGLIINHFDLLKNSTLMRDVDAFICGGQPQQFECTLVLEPPP